MKTKYLFLAVMLLCSLHILAQPIVGTWELVSMKGTDFAGKSFTIDASMERVIKIITPTHYMLIAHGVKDDSLVFNRSHAGTVILDQDKYLETTQRASLNELILTKGAFSWKIEGDKLIKYGSLTREDGKTARLEELVFKRIKSKTSYPENPSIGAWDQLSSSYTTVDGKKGSHTRETATRFELITPTHMTRISHRNNKFESAWVSAYRMEGNKIYPELVLASFPANPADRLTFTQRVTADKLYVTGDLVFHNGARSTWDDVFQKVDVNVIK
jgi:hypothetical protein